MAATEIAIFPITEGDLPDDLNTPSGKIFKEGLDIILQQPGAQRTYWGVEVENPTTARLFVDWDSVDAHVAFINSE